MIAIRQAGDAAVLLQAAGPAGDSPAAGNEVASIAAAIRAADLPGVVDVVPGAQTVLVTFAPGSQDAAALGDRLRQLAAGAAGLTPDAAGRPGASEAAAGVPGASQRRPGCGYRHRV